MENLCKKDKVLINKRRYTSARLYITKNDKIIKTIPAKDDKEKEYLKIIKGITNTKIAIFFVNIEEIKKCKSNNFFLMEKYVNDIDKDFLVSLSKKNIVNILKQILFAIFYMNNVLRIYHNDLYFTQDIRNIMYSKNKNNIGSVIKHDNLKIKLHDYVIKIIDFGWGNCKPSFRTTEYHFKYFPNNKIISEMLIFIFFFFNTLLSPNKDLNKKQLYLQKILQVYSKKIEIKLEENDELDQYNFDKYIYNNLNIVISKIEEGFNF